MTWQSRVVACTALLAALAAPVHAQSQLPAAIPVAQEFESLHFRSIGPAVMSGRIAGLAVYEANPAVFYVGTAHGGVWKTTSNTALWEPLFQTEGLISIGAVAMSQRNPDVVWVGAGESNNRQSTSWGGGLYKSTDGRTFERVGLPESRHINRIAIHPSNDDMVLVAATGPLFGPGGDRGIYRTTDGGRTWSRVVHVDEDTGGTDVVFSRTDPNVVYAAMYQRRRNACCMNGGGPGSGIWKSTDAGATWTRLRGGGLPDVDMGRIALDAFRGDGNIVYATIEGASGGAQGTTGVYRSNDGGASWERVAAANPRPMYFSHIVIDPVDPDRVYMGGVGLYMSIDGGRSWENDAALVTHDDVHAIWVNPANPEHIIIGNDGGIALSYDMSRTWKFVPNLPVGLFYHVSYDMETPFNVCGGMQDNYNWCGPSRTRFVRGIMNSDWFQILGGDGFHAIPDPRDSRIIYTESQNGNVVRRDKVTGESKSIRPTANNVVNHVEGESYRWNWDTPIFISPHDPSRLMVAANRVFVSTDRGDSWTAISPDLTTNANRNQIATMGVLNPQIRHSRNDGISMWPTIVSLAESPNQAGVFYTGTDDGVVSVSRDGGASWENITARIPGFPAGAWVSEVVPSRFHPGTVYITVDNHFQNDYESYIWASDDFGRTFRSLRGNLRGENVRTLTEDHRNGDVLYIGTETGLFVSLDRGGSWRRLQSNLPTVRIDEITLHPRDNAMLLATHGRSLWILDNASPIQGYAEARRSTAAVTLFDIAPALQWKTKNDRNVEFWGHQFFLGENPPTDAVIQFHVNRAVSDVRLHISDAAGRRVRELVAPAGRRQPGIQTLCWDMRVDPVVLPALGGPAAGPGGGGGGGGGQAAQPLPVPGVRQPLPPPGSGARNICAGGGGAGGAAGPHVPPGSYSVALVVEGQTVGTKPLTIVMDPEVRLVGADRTRWNELVMELHEMQGRGGAVAGSLAELGRQLGEASGRLDAAAGVAPDARARFDALVRDFDAVRVKFGVPAPGAQPPAGGQGGGGGGGGAAAAAAAQANALARLGAVKTAIQNIWEVPSPAMVRQAEETKAALLEALAEAGAVLGQVESVSRALQPYDVRLTAGGSQ